MPISTYSLSDNDVTYHLYTPANPTAAKDFKIGGVATSGINAKLPFKILIHGWQASVDVDWYAGVVAEYLKKGEYNVIAVDWSGPAAAMYGDAVDAAFEVAEVNTRFVQELYEKLGVAPENLHFIGHSLGAQISGLTGMYKSFKNSFKTYITSVLNLKIQTMLFKCVRYIYSGDNPLSEGTPLQLS